VRMDLGWGGTERKKGEYDFSAFDRLAAALEKHKMRAVFILDYGNPLYAEPGDKQPFTSRVGTEEFRAAFAKWAVAAVSHFKGRGYLWEMWNEPNHTGFWKPKPDVEQYTALARATGEALRGAGLLGPKGEAFIGPATSTIDLPFIEACCKAGLLEYWDAVSVHPYRQGGPESVEEEYRRLRMLIRQYAPKDKVIPVISGEWGYSAAWNDFDEDKQGKYLPRQLLTNMANDVALSIWYDWHDDGKDPKEPEHHFGLVRHEYRADRDPVYEPKFAYRAIKALTTQLGGYRFNKRLVINVSPTLSDYVLLFSKDAPRRAEVSVEESHPPATVEGDAKVEAPAYNDVALVAWRLPSRWSNGRTLLPASVGRFDVTNHLGGKLPTLEAVYSPIANPDQVQEVVEVNLTDELLYLQPGGPNRILRIAAAWDSLPLDVFARGPSVLNMRTTLRNPLAQRPLNFHYWGSDQKLINAKIEPGGSHVMASKKALYRSDEPQRIIAGLTADHSYLNQKCEVIATNPLRATVFPAMGGSVPVWIENLSEEPYRGEAGLEVKQPESGGAFRRLDRPALSLGPWERRMTLFPWADKEPGSYGFVFELDAREPQPLNHTMSVSAQKVIPVGRLSEAGADPAGDFKLAADGDAKVASEQSISWVDAPEGLPAARPEDRHAGADREHQRPFAEAGRRLGPWRWGRDHLCPLARRRFHGTDLPNGWWKDRWEGLALRHFLALRAEKRRSLGRGERRRDALPDQVGHYVPPRQHLAAGD
jgi:polysaccharide biosynthesis protein PslG